MSFSIAANLKDMTHLQSAEGSLQPICTLANREHVFFKQKDVYQVILVKTESSYIAE